MNYSLFTWTTALISCGLFLGMMALMEVGRRIGLRRLARDPDGARAGVGAIEGAIFGLLGLLLAFSFSGGAGRFDSRRQLIVEEANAIGTAYLRLNLLSPDNCAPLQDLFRQYVDARLEAYRKLPDIQAVLDGLGKAQSLQNQIWRCSWNSVRP
jgi:hypothetical protein